MILGRVIGFALICATGLPAQAADWQADATDFGERLVALGAVPGMGIAVIQSDRIVYRRGFGIADVNTGRRIDNDTYFYIASSTKALTATAVALRAARGELDLDAPVADYLPELEENANSARRPWPIRWRPMPVSMRTPNSAPWSGIWAMGDWKYIWA